MLMQQPQPQRRQQSASQSTTESHTEPMHAPPAVNSADEGINFERELEEIAQGEFELPLDQLTRGELCLLFEKYRARRLSMGLPLPEVAAHLVQAADKEARQFAEQSTLLKHAMRRVRFLSVFSPTIRQAFGFARVGSALEDVALDVRVRLNRTDEILRQQTWSSPELERALV